MSNIIDYIHSGKANAITGKELALLLRCSVRDVSKEVVKARREEGALICCTLCGPKPGYFLAETREEVEEYANSLKGRAIEIFKTRQALLKGAAMLPGSNEKNNE